MHRWPVESPSLRILDPLAELLLTESTVSADHLPRCPISFFRQVPNQDRTWGSNLDQAKNPRIARLMAPHSNSPFAH